MQLYSSALAPSALGPQSSTSWGSRRVPGVCGTPTFPFPREEKGPYLPQEQQLWQEGCPGRQHWEKGIPGLGWEMCTGTLWIHRFTLPSPGPLRHQGYFNSTKHQQDLVCTVFLGKHSSILGGKGNQGSSSVPVEDALVTAGESAPLTSLPVRSLKSSQSTTSLNLWHRPAQLGLGLAQWPQWCFVSNNFYEICPLTASLLWFMFSSFLSKWLNPTL